MSVHRFAVLVSAIVVRIALTPAVNATLVSAGPPYPRRWVRAVVVRDTHQSRKRCWRRFPGSSVLTSTVDPPPVVAVQAQCHQLMILIRIQNSKFEYGNKSILPRNPIDRIWNQEFQYPIARRSELEHI